MSRIQTPASIDAAPAPAQPNLHAVQKMFGSVPNVFRMLANAPAALDGYLSLSGALGRGALDVKNRNRVAILVSQENGCGYCLAAHTYLGRVMAKLDDAEMESNRDAVSGDPRAQAAIAFAAAIVRSRGHVDDAALAAVKAAGFSDAQVIEIVAHVALTTLTNYVNAALGTDLDFPAVAARTRQAA